MSFFEKYGQTLVVIASLIVAVFAMTAFTHTATGTLHDRLDAQDRYIDQRFDAVGQRFDAVGQRFNAMEHRFDAVDQRLDDFQAENNRRFDRLTDELSQLRQLIVDIGQRVSRNEGEIDVIREHLQIADTPAP